MTGNALHNPAPAPLGGAEGKLAGKAAIVTGASRGIGLAIAQRLVAEGARVCITARKAEALQEAVASMPAGSAIYVAGKADDADHRAAVMDRVAAEFGGLDILVNNAGINPFYGPAMDLDLGAARKLFEVNVIGTLAGRRPRITTRGSASRTGTAASSTSPRSPAGCRRPASASTG